jgi:HK97 family phage portal protein
VNWWPFSRKSTTPFSSAHLAQLLAGVFGGGATKSGASVNSTTALQVSTVLACARVIAEGCAQVPWRVMQEGPDGKSRLPAKSHPLWDLLHRKPNRWQTSFAFRETLLLHVLVGPTGAAYAFKNRVGADRRLRELVLIDPHRVREEVQNDGTLVYTVAGRDGSQRQFGEADIWHIRGPSWNGQTSLSLITLAREAIGLAMAAEETQAKLHKNGVRTTGTYSVDGNLNQKQHVDLSAWIKKQAADGFMVLDRNAKWIPHTMTGVDAQHLETRLFQVKEVCRAMRVMPIMVMESDKASTYASAEQMFIAHLVHTLLPWYERLEQSADVFLLSDEERAQGYYTLLEPAGMLRGSLKDTAEYISRLTERGVLTRNEARELLDRNPLEGLDEPLTPANMLTGFSNEPAPAGA